MQPHARKVTQITTPMPEVVAVDALPHPIAGPSWARHAQLFEEGLAKFLIVYNRITKDSLRIEDFDATEDRIRRKTMGQLINELSKHVSFPNNEVPGYFDEALKKRNFLMHRFFLERESGMSTQDERLGLISEILIIQDEFDRARIMINAMRIAMAKTLGIAEE